MDRFPNRRRANTVLKARRSVNFAWKAQFLTTFSSSGVRMLYHRVWTAYPMVTDSAHKSCGECFLPLRMNAVWFSNVRSGILFKLRDPARRMLFLNTRHREIETNRPIFR